MNGETFKATVIASLNTGTAIVMDFGYADNTPGSGDHIDTQTAAGDFQTLVQAKLVAVSLDIVTFMRYRFACVKGTHVGEIGYVDVNPAVTGALSTVDGILPPEICIAFKRSTGYSSRHDRGRVFFGPVSESFRLTGSYDSVDTSIGDLQTACNLVKANLTTSGVTLHPVILDASGNFFQGHTIQQAQIGRIFCHRRTRRTRLGA